MFEIIALFFLCRMNGRLAERKGVNPNPWKIYTILAWIIAEFIGIGIGVSLWGIGQIYGIIAFALFCAFGGYLIIRRMLEQLPDTRQSSGKNPVDDLRPPSQPPSGS